MAENVVRDGSKAFAYCEFPSSRHLRLSDDHGRVVADLDITVAFGDSVLWLLHIAHDRSH